MDEENCPICLEPYEGKQTYITKCKHKFHTECLKQVNGKVCPMCRSIFELIFSRYIVQVTEEQLIYLSNLDNKRLLKEDETIHIMSDHSLARLYNIAPIWPNIIYTSITNGRHIIIKYSSFDPYNTSTYYNDYISVFIYFPICNLEDLDEIVERLKYSPAITHPLIDSQSFVEFKFNRRGAIFTTARSFYLCTLYLALQQKDILERGLSKKTIISLLYKYNTSGKYWKEYPLTIWIRSFNLASYFSICKHEKMVYIYDSYRITSKHEMISAISRNPRKANLNEIDITPSRTFNYSNLSPQPTTTREIFKKCFNHFYSHSDAAEKLNYLDNKFKKYFYFFDINLNE